MIEYPKEFRDQLENLPTRFQCIRELDREQAMRRRVWKAKKGPNGYFFTDRNHHRQYSQLDYLKQLLTLLPEEAYRGLQYKLFRSQEARGKQQNLF